MSLRSKPRKILLLLLVFLAAALYLYKTYDIPRIISSLIGKKEKTTLIKHFPFSSPTSLEEWSDKVLHKKVSYEIQSSQGETYVRAVSDGSCSAMYYKMDMDVHERPILSWKWRIGKFPDKEFSDDLSSKEEDDFAARVYVIFSALFFSRSKVLEYIWARDLETGTIASSPYSDNIKLIVAESGPGEGGGWVLEERDIYEDYISAFNEKPKLKIGAIALMCDSDSTKSSAEAYFDEVKICIKD